MLRSVGLGVEVLQEIVAGNGLRYPKLANARYICFGGRIKTLLEEFHDLVARIKYGGRRAQAEFGSMPHHLPEPHGAIIG